MELSQLQQDILNNTSDKIIVNAAAGSGKTALLTEKVRRVLQSGVSPERIAVITFTNMAAEELIDRLGADYRPGMFVGTVHSLANYFLLSSGVETNDYLADENFEALFELVKDYHHCIKTIEYLFLDEGQDTSENQYEFIFNLIDPPKFFIALDYRQCQPAGTKILMADKTEKNIEDLQVGDQIIAYDLKQHRVKGGTNHNAAKIHVTEIQKREVPDDEEIICITTENGNTSRYTKNHKCMISLCEYNEYNYLVYLMCDKNNRFRVGKSQLKNSNHAPWREKMVAEECEKIWIIDVLKTDKEARVLEDQISYKYGIPQNTFQLDKTSYTLQDLEYIYEGLNTYQAAKQCLLDYHRDIKYPFATRYDDNHFASNAFNACYACNILPHNMRVREFVDDGHHKNRSARIVDFKRETGYSTVYSLNVEPYHTYVADKIFTHNCIYEWAGASPCMFRELERSPDVEVLSMNENYRCGKDILQFAKRIIYRTGLNDDSVSMVSNNGCALTKTLDYQLIIDEILKKKNFSDWAVLCRTNEQISKMTLMLKRAKIPHDTFRQGELTKDELSAKMKENTVKCLSIHSSKGLAFDNVIVIGARSYPTEEVRISYVAATRARKLLVWMSAPTKKKQTYTPSYKMAFGEE